MMDEFSNEQMMIDPNLPAEAFLYILEACEIGIESSDPYIRTHACTTLNNILTFVVQERERAQPKEKEMKKRRPSHTLVLNYFTQFPQVLPRMLTSVFGMILFDDNNDQWQLSRPLYTLVLLERDVSHPSIVTLECLHFFKVCFKIHKSSDHATVTRTTRICNQGNVCFILPRCTHKIHFPFLVIE